MKFLIGLGIGLTALAALQWMWTKFTDALDDWDDGDWNDY